MSTAENKEIKKLDKEIQLFLKDVVVDKKYPFSKHKITYSDFLSNKMLIVIAIREGIPYSIFDKIQNVAPFSKIYWAEFLNLSTKSLQRYEYSKKSFKAVHSEKIIEFAEVTNLGIEVFGNFEKFKLWLETPNFSLGNMKPLELLKDSYGKEMVVAELTRIEHGILA